MDMGWRSVRQAGQKRAAIHNTMSTKMRKRNQGLEIIENSDVHLNTPPPSSNANLYPVKPKHIA
jgi:hypothetical protein